MNQKVTIIIITYNPDYNKLFRTIKSAALQEINSLQIIVSDDCSQENYKKQVDDYFSNIPEISYKYLTHEKNVGTVKNTFDAIQYAEGKYTYLISPGDYFFDAKVITNLYDYCEANNVDICFGEAQYYVDTPKGLKFLKVMSPSAPMIYASKAISEEVKRLAYCTSQVVIGASMFRKTEVFMEYLDIIKEYSVYDEDSCTSFVHLFERCKSIDYFPHFVVWYEFGSGISTSGESTMVRKLKEDEYRVMEYLEAQNIKIDELHFKNTKMPLRVFKYPKLYVKCMYIRIYSIIYKKKLFVAEMNDFLREIY